MLAIFKAIEPLFSFCLGIPKFLTKLDAVSLLQAFCHLERQTRVTPLRYLEATDAYSGVERQQKITHVPSTTALFPHPFAITYHGKK
jgi:hypothetical protein